MAKNFKKKINLVLLIVILALAAILRFWQLGLFPPSLFGDEVDIGYNAYSILKTGRDYNGNSWPIHFQSVTDWRTPLYLYLTVPAIKIFGLNAFATRFPAALFGLLSILMIFFLTKELFDEQIALLASFLLAVSPWHIHYSRAAYEVTLMAFLLITATWAFIKGLRDNRFLYLAAICFTLAPYTYNIAKLFSPILLFLVGAICRKKIFQIPRRRIACLMILMAVISLPLIYDSFLGQGQGRFGAINITLDQTVKPLVNRQRGQDLIWGVQPTVSRAFHNKVLVWGKFFIKNYLVSFSPQFLFLTGDTTNPRHGATGMFYFWFVVGFVYGGYLLAKEIRKQESKLILFWAFLAPIPAAMTINGGGHATRLFVGLPALIIIIAYGFQRLLTLLEKKITPYLIMVIFVGLIAFSLIFYLEYYYFNYSLDTYRWWNYGYEQAIDFVRTKEDKVEQIIISRSYEMPMIHFLFHYQYDPTKFHQILREEGGEATAASTDRIEKYRFATIAKGDVTRPPKTLYVAAPWDEDWGWNLIEEIKNLEGEVVFKILYSENAEDMR